MVSKETRTNKKALAMEGFSAISNYAHVLLRQITRVTVNRTGRLKRRIEPLSSHRATALSPVFSRKGKPLLAVPIRQHCSLWSVLLAIGHVFVFSFLNYPLLE